jgi:ATP-dependent helicase/nuclease subunit B
MGFRGARSGVRILVAVAQQFGGFGYVESPCDPKRRDYLPADDFVERAVAQFQGAARMWLTGDEPFTAKLHPDYAPYAEYDQLMRRDEWYGRD